MKVLAVIPAYNEQECLADTVCELIATCPGIDYLIVNDGSTDNTAAICDELHFCHVDLPINTGLASCFRTGMKYALRHDYDAVIQFDADGQHVPSFIPAMLHAMEESDCDIVCGSRYLMGERASGMRDVGSHIISLLIKYTTGTTISDPTCGLRMYGRRIIPHFVWDLDFGPEPDTLALLIRNGASIREIPVIVRERQGGESYLKPFRAARYMMRICASLILFLWFR